MSIDRLYGHTKVHKRRTEFLAFARYLRSLRPITERIAIITDNYGPHRSARVDSRVGDWAAANNVELAYTPFYSSWLNRFEPQFTALRRFALDGTDHPSHKAPAGIIRRFLTRRNRHATEPKLRKVIRRASPIKRAEVA
ncbi:transposase [Paeniglutamicibacter sp. R2-26]|uniref:transposase n=1 Tax=Paeniglutamicibacter sp. R2-26 TaxID=3144417 RepID=UPI003EE511FA